MNRRVSLMRAHSIYESGLGYIVGMRLSCNFVNVYTIQLTSDVCTRRLRSTDTVTCVVRRSNNTFGDRCFASAGPRLWNTLPAHLRQCDIVSDNLNGCSRLICVVLETAALCDISVRSAVYKSSYLLTYSLTCTRAHPYCIRRIRLHRFV